MQFTIRLPFAFIDTNQLVMQVIGFINLFETIF